jgi:hypothetical protein
MLGTVLIFRWLAMTTARRCLEAAEDVSKVMPDSELAEKMTKVAADFNALAIVCDPRSH